MSKAIQCDSCKTAVVATREETEAWLHVEWGYGATADYCTAACAVVGIEAERDKDAALMLAAMDD